NVGQAVSSAELDARVLCKHQFLGSSTVNKQRFEIIANVPEMGVEFSISPENDRLLRHASDRMIIRSPEHNRAQQFRVYPARFCRGPSAHNDEFRESFGNSVSDFRFSL